MGSLLMIPPLKGHHSSSRRPRGVTERALASEGPTWSGEKSIGGVYRGAFRGGSWRLLLEQAPLKTPNSKVYMFLVSSTALSSSFVSMGWWETGLCVEGCAVLASRGFREPWAHLHIQVCSPSHLRRPSWPSASLTPCPHTLSLSVIAEVSDILMLLEETLCCVFRKGSLNSPLPGVP